MFRTYKSASGVDVIHRYATTSDQPQEVLRSAPPPHCVVPLQGETQVRPLSKTRHPNLSTPIAVSYTILPEKFLKLMLLKFLASIASDSAR